MKTKPWPLIILAIAHLLAPFGNLIINALMNNVTPWTYFLALIHPKNLVHGLIFFLIPIVSAGLIYACKKWTYWAYLALMTVPFVYSFFSWRAVPSITTGLVLCTFYVINSLIVGYFVLPAVRRVYFDSRLRWWETKPRYGTDYQALVTAEAVSAKGQIKNISGGGIFLATKALIPENVDLKLEFRGAGEDLKLVGHAIYHRSVDPIGYGIKFDLDAPTEDLVLNLIARLKDEGAFIVSRAPGPEDSFFYWVKSLLQTREAWIPQASVKGGSSESPQLAGSIPSDISSNDRSTSVDLSESTAITSNDDKKTGS